MSIQQIIDHPELKSSKKLGRGAVTSAADILERKGRIVIGAKWEKGKFVKILIDRQKIPFDDKLDKNIYLPSGYQQIPFSEYYRYDLTTQAGILTLTMI
jgi:hypothetical protein